MATASVRLPCARSLSPFDAPLNGAVPRRHLIKQRAEMVRGDLAAAAATLKEARGRFGNSPTIEASGFNLAFATRDEALVERTIATAPDTLPVSLMVGHALTATGRLEAGRLRMERAAKELERRGLREVAATWLAELADGQAPMGRHAYAHTMRAVIERDAGENNVAPLILGLHWGFARP